MAAWASVEIIFLQKFGEIKEYRNKQIEVYAVEEEKVWLVLTVIVKYF